MFLLRCILGVSLYFMKLSLILYRIYNTMSCFKFTKNGEWVVIAAPIATSVNNVLLEMPGKLPLIEAYVIHSIVDFLLNWKAQELEQKASPERPSEGGLSNI